MKSGILVLLLGCFMAIGTANEYGLESGEFEKVLDEVYKNTVMIPKEDIFMREMWPKFVRLFPETANVHGIEFEIGKDYTCQTESKINPKLGEMIVGSVKFLLRQKLHRVEVYARMLLDDNSKAMELKVVNKNKDSSEAEPPYQVSCTFSGDNFVKLTFTIPVFTIKERSSFNSPACLVTLESIEVTKLGFPVPNTLDDETVGKLGQLYGQAAFVTTGWKDAMTAGLTEAIMKKANEGGQQQWVCTSPEMKEKNTAYAKLYVYLEKYKKYCGQL